MKKLKFAVVILGLGLALVANAARPKYVFLFIGDGYTTPQRTLAEEFSELIGRGPLVMNHFPVRTDTATHSASSPVTDSAAAVTAIACGEKTVNGHLGVSTNGVPLQSVAELAHGQGMKVGIMTTVTIIHATPAGFYAHNLNRGDNRGIAEDLLKSGFEYFAASGLGDWGKSFGGYYTTSGVYVEPKQESASVGRSPYLRWQDAGGVFVKDDPAAFEALKPGRPAWCVFWESGMPFAIDDPSMRTRLAKIVAKGIELLDGDKGFFMMCEGGRIDYCGHANDAAANARESIAFDDAVKVALEFQKRRPNETLIVTTGDHETGGLVVDGLNAGTRDRLKVLTKQTCSVTIFSDRVKQRIRETNGRLTWNDFLPMLAEAFGLHPSIAGQTSDEWSLSDSECAEMKAALDKDNVKCLKTSAANKKEKKKKRNFVAVAQLAKKIMSQRAGLVWKSGGHTALPTMTTAIGCGAERFRDVKDNTGIALTIKGLLSQ